jgi:hypothetical protein
MKRTFTLLTLLLILGTATTRTWSQNRLTIGANYVHRSIKSYEDYGYPRLSAEYRATRSSSFEVMAEYINLNHLQNIDLVSWPLGVGYKLNFVPLLTKNERITSTFEVYNSLRYVLVLDNQKNHTGHYIRYAVGANVFVTSHLGLNGEMVFGRNMRTTFALGMKYRF